MEEEVFVLAEETPPCPYYNRGHCRGISNGRGSPTLPKPAGKSNAKRAPHAKCAIRGPVTCFSDQPEDATDKIADTDIWQPKKPPQF
jgi:hypothetical protein